MQLPQKNSDGVGDFEAVDHPMIRKPGLKSRLALPRGELPATLIVSSRDGNQGRQPRALALGYSRCRHRTSLLKYGWGPLDQLHPR
jgi:hypothetical protein